MGLSLLMTRREFLGSCTASMIALNASPAGAATPGARRIAVLGLGSRGLRAALSLPAHATLAAISDPDANAAARAVRRLGRVASPRLALSDDEVFALSEIDTVVLAIPSHRVPPLAITALRRGKRVIVDGPPPPGEDLRPLAEAAGEANLRFVSRGADPEFQGSVCCGPPTSVRLACSYGSAPGRQLRLPDDLFAELAPIVTLLGSAEPVSLYAAEGRAGLADGGSARTLDLMLRFPTGRTLHLQGRELPLRRDQPHPPSGIVSTTVRITYEDGQEVSLGSIASGEQERDPFRSQLALQRMLAPAAAGGLPGPALPGSLRDDLIAAHILLNARA